MTAEVIKAETVADGQHLETTLVIRRDVYTTKPLPRANDIPDDIRAAVHEWSRMSGGGA